MTIPKTKIRQLIAENDLTNVASIHSLLKESFKEILQEVLEAELDVTLGYEKNKKEGTETTNKRSGYSKKKVKSQYGEFSIAIPRDREGEFELKLIPKHQRDISGIEEKIISLYAHGLSTRDIHDHLQDLYGIEVSADMVSQITNKILPEVKEWQSRPLSSLYPFMISRNLE